MAEKTTRLTVDRLEDGEWVVAEADTDSRWEIINLPAEMFPGDVSGGKKYQVTVREVEG